MTSISIAQMLDAVTSTLATAPILAKAMSYDELTEGMNDLPALEVYWDSLEQDRSTETDRTTFGGGVRQSGISVAIDYYAQQRRHIGEDMAKLVAGLDQLVAILEAQRLSPYFGLAGIKTFGWTAERVTFEYGEAAIKYVGVRFALTLGVF